MDREKSKPRPEFGSPKNIRSLHSPYEGTISLKIDKVSAAFTYLYEYALINAGGKPGPWVSIPCKYITYRFTGLNAGTLYCIRVAAVAKDGRMIYTPTIKVFSGLGE